MPSSQRLCCTWLGVRATFLYNHLANGVPVMQFTKNSLENRSDHLPRGKITLSPHQQGSEVHSQVSSTTAGSPAPGHTLTAPSSLKESTSGANKGKSLWFLEKEFCCQSVHTWATIKFGGPICGLCLWFSICPGVLTVGMKSLSGSEWKPITAPRPLASSPKSHLTPAGSGASSNSWRKRRYHRLWQDIQAEVLRGLLRTEGRYRASTGSLSLQTSRG